MLQFSLFLSLYLSSTQFNPIQFNDLCWHHNMSCKIQSLDIANINADSIQYMHLSIMCVCKCCHGHHVDISVYGYAWVELSGCTRVLHVNSLGTVLDIMAPWSVLFSCCLYLY